MNGSIRFKKFRAPRYYYGSKISLLAVSAYLTRTRFVVYSLYPFQPYHNPVIDVTFDDPRIAGLDCSIVDDRKLRVLYDASLFNLKWSGTLDVRFKTGQASAFLAGIERAQKAMEDRAA